MKAAAGVHSNVGVSVSSAYVGRCASNIFVPSARSPVGAGTAAAAAASAIIVISKRVAVIDIDIVTVFYFY